MGLKEDLRRLRDCACEWVIGVSLKANSLDEFIELIQSNRIFDATAQPDIIWQRHVGTNVDKSSLAAVIRYQGEFLKGSVHYTQTYNLGEAPHYPTQLDEEILKLTALLTAMNSISQIQAAMPTARPRIFYQGRLLTEQDIQQFRKRAQIQGVIGLPVK
jgi:hypothetical protein